MAKGAHLKRTTVTLACGESVKVTELPGTRRVWELVQKLEAASVKEIVDTLRELIELSLSYEYTAEQIEELYESGAINLLRASTAEGIAELMPILGAMHSALAALANEKEPEPPAS